MRFHNYMTHRCVGLLCGLDGPISAEYVHELNSKIAKHRRKTGLTV